MSRKQSFHELHPPPLRSKKRPRRARLKKRGDRRLPLAPTTCRTGGAGPLATLLITILFVKTRHKLKEKIKIRSNPSETQTKIQMKSVTDRPT